MSTSDMRAAVYYGPGDIRISRVPIPTPGPGEILVRVLRSGLCGTDVTEWTSGPKMIPLYEEHPHSHHRGPMTPGHEIVGEVVEGTRTGGTKTGGIVVSGASVPCWECDRCQEGRTNICQRLYSLGLNAPGGHAEYVVGPTESFVAVPRDMDIDVAGLAQPLAVGIHAARRAGAKPGDRVVVIGAGAIGTFVLAGLRHVSTDIEVTVVDIDDERLERAARLGADRTINPVAGGELPSDSDLVIEASGAPAQLGKAIHMVRAGGRVLAVGMPPDPAEIDVHHMVWNEITLDSSVALLIRTDMEAALEVLATTSLASEVFDSVRPLGRITETLDDLASGKITGKVLLDPSR